MLLFLDFNLIGEGIVIDEFETKLFTTAITSNTRHYISCTITAKLLQAASLASNDAVTMALCQGAMLDMDTIEC